MEKKRLENFHRIGIRIANWIGLNCIRCLIYVWQFVVNTCQQIFFRDMQISRAAFIAIDCMQSMRALCVQMCASVWRANKLISQTQLRSDMCRMLCTLDTGCVSEGERARVCVCVFFRNYWFTRYYATKAALYVLITCELIIVDNKRNEMCFHHTDVGLPPRLVPLITFQHPAWAPLLSSPPPSQPPFTLRANAIIGVRYNFLEANTHTQTHKHPSTMCEHSAWKPHSTKYQRSINGLGAKMW